MTEIVSALVLLKPADGSDYGPDTNVTADNLAKYSPSQEATWAAQRAFGELGFEVGPMIGISFAITAAPETFVRVFGVKLMEQSPGDVGLAGNDGGFRYELPHEALSGDLVKLIRAVTFSPPDELMP